ncbi:NACHT domain-containing protein [Planctomicrobium piriforme]|uniref:NACHT domain-containing protein n=1 Tax=Planctomicrobium piriforme TaxID=1576369 RepID=A0A1I3M6M5_9PLAN|nr:hypothetical protein [Planctomicrobium piriforme]SFI92336.1 hypothetical protein SAMN05421753_113167 [Planctomicrobium piriforme]
MDYFRFTPKAFEQLTQSIAIHILGPGVNIFGSGPDGGREATFDGEVPYPFESERWRGYGIIQAKCKEKTEGTQKDQDWALTLLAGELKAFAEGYAKLQGKPTSAKPRKNSRSAPKRSRAPEYYIFCTNVVLTPADSSGGKDLADALIKSYYSTVPLKGHAIWDQTQLQVFLDSYAELRKRFAQFLTPDDLLAEVIASFTRQMPDMNHIATSYMYNALMNDQDSQLDQAGSKTDDRTSLAKVFIDLHASEAKDEKTRPETAESKPSGQGVLDILLSAGNLSLDSKSLFQSRERQNEDAYLYSRFVVIGGPGSGKSTLGQFLAQIYRAAWIEQLDATLFEPEVLRCVKEIREHCCLHGIPSPASLRVPFRVSLSHFARYLATHAPGEATLESYLLQLFCDPGRLSSNDFTEWVYKMPLLLLLDGLDEVPSSSNRSEVCEAVRVFFSEATSRNANLLVMATTRPEGYNNEFTENWHRFLYLMPLGIAKAMQYAELLTIARFGKESNRNKDMLNMLTVAAKHPLTAKLLESPLQVTFVVTLIASGGSPPKDRWRLFDDYYHTIYKREQQKCKDTFVDVLGGQSALVDRMHYTVGYILQARGEKAGRTDAEMDLADFDDLVDDLLEGDGWAGDEKHTLCSRVVEAATTRLIFITSKIKGKLSFDVRSLQEFMACEMLTACSDLFVQGRISRIAGAAYWRNVFLFVAGKYYATAQYSYLQPLVYECCEKLNDENEDPVAAAVTLGSQVAMDLLEDGAVTTAPRWHRKYAMLALQCLAEMPDVYELYGTVSRRPLWARRLVRLYSDDIRKEYVESVRLVLTSRHYPETIGAWYLLVGLIVDGVDWAQGIAEEFLPEDPEDCYRMLAYAGRGNAGADWVSAKLDALVLHVSPKVVANLPVFINAHERAESIGSTFEALSTVVAIRERRMKVELIDSEGKSIGVELAINPLFSEEINDFMSRWPSDFSACHPGWRVVDAVIKVRRAPGAEMLAKVVEGVAGVEAALLGEMMSIVPWVVQLCFEKIIEGMTASEVAGLVRSGAVGDYAEWRAAEERWLSVGVGSSDILQPTAWSKDDSLSYHRVGFPWSGVYGYSRSTSRDVKACCGIIEEMIDKEVAAANVVLTNIYWFNLDRDRGEFTGDVLVESVRRMAARPLSKEAMELDFLSVVEVINGDEDPWVDVLDTIGRECNLPLLLRTRLQVTDAVARSLYDAYVRTPFRQGLLVYLSCIPAAQRPSRVPDVLLDIIGQKNVACLSATIVLRAQQILGCDDADGFVGEMKEISRLLLSEATAVALVLRALRDVSLLNAGHQRLLLLLRERLPLREVWLRSELLRILNQSRTSASSGLLDGEIAGPLGLPDARGSAMANENHKEIGVQVV